MWWLKLLWSSHDPKTLRWCDTEDVREEENPRHYWATRRTAAHNLPWWEMVHFPCGKARVGVFETHAWKGPNWNIMETTTVLIPADSFLLKFIFQGPVSGWAWGKKIHTNGCIKKISNLNDLPPAPWTFLCQWNETHSFHEMSQRRGIPECEGDLATFLFLYPSGL